MSFIEEMVAVNRGKLRGETAQDERGETKATRSGVVKIVEVRSSRVNRGKAVAAGREALIMASSGGVPDGAGAGGWDDLGGWGDEAPTTGGWDEPGRAVKSEEEMDDEEPAPIKEKKKKKKKRRAEEDGRGEPEPEAAEAKKKTKKTKKKSLDGNELKAETPDSLGRKKKKKKVLFFD